MDNLLNYTSEGNGNAVVFVHGFCESTEIWSEYKHHFTDNFKVICIDLPGHGQSDGQGTGTSIESMASMVKDTLTELKIQKPVMVGHSLGGYVTIALAEMFPSYLSGFCVFHSSAFADAPDKKEGRNKTAEYVKQHGTAAFANPFVPGLFYHKRRDELKESIAYATHIANKMTVENIVNAVLAMRDRKDRIEVLKEINIPVAFIIGKDDTAIPMDKSLAQCHLPKQASVLFLSQTGHMGMFERPKETVLFLKGFFNQVSAINKKGFNE